MRRRDFLSVLLAGRAAGQATVRAITRGPGHHWFGYYDKLQFDPSGRYALGMRVNFEHRSPRAEDEIRLGVIDLADGDRWREIGVSRAWNWQQGCMLQWIPGSRDEVVWNDREDGRFVARVMNVFSGRMRTINSPVYCLHPNGQEALTPDFSRLNDCRPGYGYAGVPDARSSQAAPEDAGIWRVDLRTGESRLAFSFAAAAAIPYPKGYSAGAKHWFNHLLYAPGGKRFIFLHRWRGEAEGAGFSTRMFTMGRTGKQPYILDPFGKTSHFIWRDPRHVLAWAWHPSLGKERFYLYRDGSTSVTAVGPDVMTVNGHCTYLPGNRFILNDTYPDRERLQHVYLYDLIAGRRIALGSFHSPREYAGEWRCDTHPRFSPDGRQVIIDSAHGGNGRQMYLLSPDALMRNG